MKIRESLNLSKMSKLESKRVMEYLVQQFGGVKRLGSPAGGPIHDYFSPPKHALISIPRPLKTCGHDYHATRGLVDGCIPAGKYRLRDSESTIDGMSITLEALDTGTVVRCLAVCELGVNRAIIDWRGVECCEPNPARQPLTHRQLFERRFNAQLMGD